MTQPPNTKNPAFRITEAPVPSPVPGTKRHTVTTWDDGRKKDKCQHSRDAQRTGLEPCAGALALPDFVTYRRQIAQPL